MIIELDAVYEITDVYGVVTFPAKLIGTYTHYQTRENLFLFERDQTVSKYIGCSVQTRIKKHSSNSLIEAVPYFKAVHYANKLDDEFGIDIKPTVVHLNSIRWPY